MQFVPSSNGQKVDPATRKLIRSHAMRGKKQKRVLPKRNILVNGCDMVPGYVDPTAIDFEDIARMYTPPPRRIGSDLSFVPLPEDLDCSLLINIAKISPISRRIIYPLISAIGIRADNSQWLRLCSSDAAALHITAFAVDSFIDTMLRGREIIAPAAMLHFQKGLNLLRERLSCDDKEAKTSDGTIAVVLKLAGAAAFAGEHEVAKQHIKGVQSMIDHRGGIAAFYGNHILIESLRCDLGIAMLSNSAPIFFRQPMYPTPEYPFTLLPEFSHTKHSRDMLEMTENVDTGLMAAWSIMRRFCLLVDLGTQTKRLISTTVIDQTMTSVMYRLMYMSFPKGSLDEAVRLALLTYSHHVFLQWRDVKLSGRAFQKAFRNTMVKLDAAEETSPRFMLWVLTVGAVSLFDVWEDVWLLRALRRYVSGCSVTSWKEARDVLKSFLWVPLLDDVAGQRIHDEICQPRQGQNKSSWCAGETLGAGTADVPLGF